MPLLDFLDILFMRQKKKSGNFVKDFSCKEKMIEFMASRYCMKIANISREF